MRPCTFHMYYLIRSASAQERTYRLLASVGGADHCIPHCNHLTLFGSAVSVVEFPRKFLCWMLQKFHVRRRCFTVLRLSFCSIALALKALREDHYHRVRATPLFSGEKDIAVRLLLGESHFNNSRTQRLLPEIANIQSVDST